ncbi:aspartyl/asparaginyl beta-hydroxylase domain-containing protein [Corallococcus sp. AS-1-6]|uniref:aspartyl/asparaginyl beta-hydroxylase domain-containing protein n=1 Tax=Corallococcus sp. AS-1-6 TaxID=2874599 RepID=UPI001CC050BD|nr:aspartyl/asparaginyl beta-hydroxylase domain-containing protein [Corallococcus sp. AS-1-6]MBZ4374125.1 aspartyl/asparaginyl beta-hydroxylase domain-containing protein [Corallococcus sp. AS-1-6]
MPMDPRAASLMALKNWAQQREIEPAKIARLVEGLSSAEVRGAPLQNPVMMCPGLEAKPWHDPQRYAFVAALEQAFPSIRAELLEQYGSLSTHPESRMLAVRGKWDTFYFFNTGHRFAENQASCPNTTRALSHVPGIEVAGMAYFSVMAPGTQVKPHCGFTNTRIRCHLGLVVPPDCEMRVGSETRGWEEGRCIVFDDSFEHEVRNDSDRFRAVLLVDTWHPDLSEVERQALTFLMSSWKAFLN